MVQHAEKTVDLINVYDYHKGRRVERQQSQAPFSGAQWQDQKQWAQTETWEVLFEHQESLFYCHSDQAQAQVAQRGCGVSILQDIPKPKDVVLDSLVQVPVLEQGSRTRHFPEVPSNLTHSVIQWKCIWLC